MKLKKVLSGFLAMAIAATTTAIVMPLSASAASLENAPEGTETVLKSLSVDWTATTAWDNGDWTQFVDVDEAWMSNENIYVKATMSNLGTFTTGEEPNTEETPAETLLSWGWSGYNWATFIKWYNNNTIEGTTDPDTSQNFEVSFTPVDGSTGETVYAYVPISDFKRASWGGICGNIQAGHINSITLDKLEIVEFSTAVEIESVTVTPETLALKVGDEARQLTAAVAPADAAQDVVWASSDTNVATVSEDGKVTAVATGEADITATAEGTKIVGTCKVAVTNPATAIVIDKTATVLVGAEKTLAVTTTPANADKLTYTWTSSATNIATVNDGVVKGVAAGTATITVKAGTLTAECTVTVTEETKPATKVELNKTTLTLEEEGTATLTATITPEGSTDTIAWSSSNEDVATVDSNGKVTAIAEGKATITAKANADVKAECAVTVTAKPEPEPSGALWEGSKVQDTSWTWNPVDVAADKLADVKAGDTIKITLTIDKGAEYSQLKIMDGSDDHNVLTSVKASEWGTVDVAASPYEFELNAADAATAKASGLTITGFNVTITKIELIKGESEDSESNYDTQRVETVTDYVPATTETGKTTELVVMSITEIDAAKNESYTITVTSDDGKSYTITTSDCYKSFKYNTASGEKTETAAGYFIIVKVTGVPDGTNVTVTIKPTK